MRRPQAFVSLHGYQRSWASADLMAGLMLLVIAVPEQLATSRLAGMPPITGFYAFVAGTVVFALLGSNPQMSVGADSTIAPLFATGVSALALTGSPHYVQLVAILAVMVGLMVMLVSILRLGWIAEFLSTPIVAGFLSGVAVIIVIHQLPDLLGLPATTGSNGHRIASTFSHLSQANGWTVAIGAGVLLVMFVSARLDRRIPGGLIGLVGSTALVAALGLQAHGVAVLGTIQSGAPHVGLTGLSLSTLGSLAPLAAVVALVVVTQTAATTRAFAEQGGYDVEAGRDFLGVGAGSVIAGLVGSFPVDASPPRTGAVATAGGRTQAGALGAALAIIVLIPVANVLEDVPLTTLAAILIYVAIRLFKPRDLRAIARFDLFEFGLTSVTLLTVVLVGVEQGIGVAVGLAILDRVRLSARPQLHVLGRIPGTTSWAPLSMDLPAAQIRGVLVLLFATPLWYANAVHFRDEVAGALERAPDTRILILDTLGMSDVDFTGSRALGHVLDACARSHVAFGVARAGDHLHDTLQRSGLEERIGESHFFPSVNEAVTALADEPQPPS
ncbi:MAG TPA: SulP family inorganic anion transporter [Acidimicrobiales bacterium]|jgi:high affinity sulfate transporter 1|nr:SulP family inorganic anion transporter [Acidimicrobiales bacterium]